MDIHSQLAFVGSSILSTSIERRPWDVARMTFGSTPISFPMLSSGQLDFPQAVGHLVMLLWARPCSVIECWVLISGSVKEQAVYPDYGHIATEHSWHKYRTLEAYLWKEKNIWTYVSQCFSTAAVESIIVPSMSNSKPLKTAFCNEGGELLSIELEDIMINAKDSRCWRRWQGGFRVIICKLLCCKIWWGGRDIWKRADTKQSKISESPFSSTFASIHSATAKCNKTFGIADVRSFMAGRILHRQAHVAFVGAGGSCHSAYDCEENMICKVQEGNQKQGLQDGWFEGG